MTPSTLENPILENRGAPSVAPIVDKIRDLRRRIALWLAVDGIGRVLLLLVILIGIDLVLDRQFSMDRPQRIVVLALIGLVLAVVVYRRLIRPLSRKLSDDALCLMVQQRHKELGDGLISALQLSREPDWQSRGSSATLVAATIERGVAAAKPLNFHGVLRGGRFIANALLVVFLISVLGAIAAAVASTETMSIWFDRNVLLSDRPWPQDVYLTFDGAATDVLQVPRAEAWPIGISVRLARKDVASPEEVSYDLRSAGEYHTERMERADGGRYFSGKLPPIDVESQVRAVSSGGGTGWVRVVPIDRPLVKSLKLTVTPPKYTGASTEILAEGKGPYSLLPGSRLHLEGIANKPLSQATITLGTTRRTMNVRKGLHFSLEMEYRPDAAGVYSIDLTDTEQLPLASRAGVGPLTSRVPVQFTLRTRLDRLPLVKVRLTGIGGIITSRAKLPLSISIDDDFAITDANIHYHVRSSVEGETGRSDLVRPPGIEKQFGGSAVRINHVLDVGAIKVPVGSELTFEVKANDNNDVTPPRTGTSNSTVLRVVSDDEFRADLMRREKEQRQEVERLQKVLVGVVADTRELVRAGAAGKTWTAGTEQAAARLTREQKAMGPALGMIARRIEDLLTEAINNGLEAQDGPLAQRLRSHVFTPLTQLADASIPEVVRRLEEARSESGRVPQREQALSAALTGQAKIETELNQILKYMVKAEDYQLVLSLIMELQHSQADVLTRAEKERLERIKRIFEQGGAGAEK